jgi:hypothetical protein
LPIRLQILDAPGCEQTLMFKVPERLIDLGESRVARTVEAVANHHHAVLESRIVPPVGREEVPQRANAKRCPHEVH